MSHHPGHFFRVAPRFQVFLTGQNGEDRRKLVTDAVAAMPAR
jgi:hypothetical protein